MSLVYIAILILIGYIMNIINNSSFSMDRSPRCPAKRGDDVFAPGPQAPVQRTTDGEDDGGSACSASTSERVQQYKQAHEPRRWAVDGGSVPQNTLVALVNSLAIRNALRLQPRGYRPGVAGGRVGLLEGLRTRDMEKYDEAR